MNLSECPLHFSMNRKFRIDWIAWWIWFECLILDNDRIILNTRINESMNLKIRFSNYMLYVNQLCTTNFMTIIETRWKFEMKEIRKSGRYDEWMKNGYSANIYEQFRLKSKLQIVEKSFHTLHSLKYNKAYVINIIYEHCTWSRYALSITNEKHIVFINHCYCTDGDIKKVYTISLNNIQIVRPLNTPTHLFNHTRWKGVWNK